MTTQMDQCGRQRERQNGEYISSDLSRVSGRDMNKFTRFQFFRGKERTFALDPRDQCDMYSPGS